MSLKLVSKIEMKKKMHEVMKQRQEIQFPLKVKISPITIVFYALLFIFRDERIFNNLGKDFFLKKHSEKYGLKMWLK